MLIVSLLIILVGLAGLIGLLGVFNLRLNVVLVSLTTLTAIGIWKQLIVVNSFVGCMPAIVSMLFVPGYLITLAFPGAIKGSNLFDRLPLYFGITIFFWTVVALFAYRITLSADLVIWFCFAFDIVGLILLFIVKDKYQTDLPLFSNRPLLSLENLYFLIFAVLILLAAVLVGYRSQFHLLHFDMIDHLAGFGKIAENQIITGGDFFIGPPNSSIAQYASNPWYLAAGLTSRLINKDTAVLYICLSSLMMILTLFTFRSLIFSLARNNLVATIGTIIVIVPWIYECSVQWQIFNSVYFETLPFPATLGEAILYPLLCSYLFRYLFEVNNAGYWVLTAMLAFATMGQHLQFAIWVPYIMGFALISALILSKSSFAKIKISALIIEICLMSVFIGYLTISYPLASGPEAYPDMPLPVDNLRYIAGNLWVINESLYAMDPRVLIQYVPMFVLYLAVIVWVKYPRDSACDNNIDDQAYKRLIVASVCILVSPLIIVLNPLLVPKLIALFQSDVPIYRMSSVNEVLREAVIYGSVACFIVWCVIRYRRRMIISKIFPLLAIFLFTILPFSVPSVRTAFSNVITNPDNYPSFLDISRDELYEKLSNMKQGIIAAPPSVGKYIVAFTPHYTVAEAFDINMLDKIRFVDNDNIITYRVSDKMMRDLLNKYNCRYVVVSQSSSGLAKFETDKNIFYEVFRTNQYAVFAVRN